MTLLTMIITILSVITIIAIQEARDLIRTQRYTVKLERAEPNKRVHHE